MIFFRPSHQYDLNWEMTPQLRWLIWTSGWRGVFVFFVLLAIPLTFWKGAEAYKAMKIWRAERLITQSEEAQQQQNFQLAAEKLRQATALLQNHPLTLRAVARYQVERQDIGALKTYAYLIQTGEATTADKITFCRQAFRLGRAEMAAPLLQELSDLEETKGTSVLLALKAQQSASEQRWSEAVKLARLASTTLGSDEDKVYVQSVLARLLLHPSPDVSKDSPEFMTEGMDLLTSLALRQDEAGLEALGMLVSLSRNQETSALFLHREVKSQMEAAEMHPRADEALKVGAWNLRVAAEPSKAKEIAREFFDHFKTQSSPVLRLEAARWLNQNGMHLETLEMMDTSMHQSKDWFVLYLDATAALGRWEDVFHTLRANDREVPLEPALRLLFEFRAAMETGRQPDIGTAWRDIQIAVKTAKASDQLYVAGYAEQIGFPDEAARIYERLIEREEELIPESDKLSRPRRLACYYGFLRTGAGAKTLKELCLLMTDFATEFPEIDEVQNDNAYLQLLSGAETEQAASTAQKLTQKKPELLAYRTTLALAALRKQKSSEAAAVYAGWNIDWSTAQDRFKAVYTAAMRASGRMAEAEKMAAKIKAEKLRPEERELAGLP